MSEIDQKVVKTDEELMKAYQRGDEGAFQALYSRHSAKVYGFVRSKIANRALADDVFQATFMKLHATRAKYDPAFPFAPWLFTICRSVLVDNLRKERRVQEIPDMERIEQAAALQPATAASAWVGLDALSATQKTALQLRYGEDLSFEEIANRLETTPANVRQVVSRSVRKLRFLLKKEGEK